MTEDKVLVETKLQIKSGVLVYHAAWHIVRDLIRIALIKINSKDVNPHELRVLLDAAYYIQSDFLGYTKERAEKITRVLEASE